MKAVIGDYWGRERAQINTLVRAFPCACVCVLVRSSVRMCVCVCVGGGGSV